MDCGPKPAGKVAAASYGAAVNGGGGYWEYDNLINFTIQVLHLPPRAFEGKDPPTSPFPAAGRPAHPVKAYYVPPNPLPPPRRPSTINCSAGIWPATSETLSEDFFFHSINIPDEDASYQRLKVIKEKAAELNVLGRDIYQYDRSMEVLKTAAANEGAGAGAGLLQAGVVGRRADSRGYRQSPFRYKPGPRH